MDLSRYSIITDKNPREIVLLKGFPCKWSQCSFCDYIHDNDINQEEIIKINKEVLSNVTGKFSSLEVINSGSVFELPNETLEDIKNIVVDKNIEVLYFESHWIYRNRLNEIRKFFDVPIIFKCGVETFDDYFRNKVLKKGMIINNPEEVSNYFSSICLLVGIKGQTKDMIRNDVDTLLKYFKRGCINIFNENTTNIKRDYDLIKWFLKEYNYLNENPNIEILVHNTDFGVGDNSDEN